MRQISLKIKNYAENISIVDNGDLNRRALHFILVSFGILASFYVVILGTMIFNIVERRALETSARNLGSEVLELELTYLEMSEKIDANLAKALGFKEARPGFAARKSLGSVEFANNGF